MSKLIINQIVITEDGLPFRLTEINDGFSYARAEFETKLENNTLRLATDEECNEFGLTQVYE